MRQRSKASRTPAAPHCSAPAGSRYPKPDMRVATPAREPANAPPVNRPRQRQSCPSRMPPGWHALCRCDVAPHRSGMDISSSTVTGRFTWPEMANSLVPWLFLRPMEENHSGPRRRMVGDTATVSTLVTGGGGGGVGWVGG